MRTKVIQYILAWLFLLMAGGTAMAQDDFNPDNPPEPNLTNRITVEASPSEAGSVSGGGVYTVGTSVKISTSRYSSDYTFKHWLKNGEVYSESMSFNYVMENEMVTFTAVYDFTPDNPEEPNLDLNHRLYVESDTPDACLFNITSGDEVEVGRSISVRAYVNQSFIFKGWYIGKTKLGDQNPMTYTMPDENVTLTAHFAFDFNPANPGEPQVDVINSRFGDVNKDGTITIADVTALVNIMLDKDVAESYYYGYQEADVNGSGTINSEDLTLLVDEVLGKKMVIKAPKLKTVALQPNVEVYIFNVGTKKFLGQGEAWGTQAVVANKGLKYILKNKRDDGGMIPFAGQHHDGRDDNGNLVTKLPEGQYWLYSPDVTVTNRHCLDRWRDDTCGQEYRCSFTDQADWDERGVWQIASVSYNTYTLQVPQGLSDTYADFQNRYVEGEYAGVWTEHGSNWAANNNGGVTYGLYSDIVYENHPENCQWQFVLVNDYEVYVAKCKLVDIINEIKNKGLSIRTWAAEILVNKEDATLSEVQQMIDLLIKYVDYVDLGLPSGTLWATYNIGATSPEDYGDYFAWGETEGYDDGKTNFDWSTYKWCKGTETTITKYCNDSSYGYEGFTDNLKELKPEDDAAYVNWGPAWRMPSDEQFKELINSNYTTTEWTTQNGVNGRKITSKTNGNSIFLPTAGCRNGNSLENAGTHGRYMSRTLNTSYPYGARVARYLYFNMGTIDTSVGNSSDFCRYIGFTVRPVRSSE